MSIQDLVEYVQKNYSITGIAFLSNEEFIDDFFGCSVETKKDNLLRVVNEHLPSNIGLMKFRVSYFDEDCVFKYNDIAIPDYQVEEEAKRLKDDIMKLDEYYHDERAKKEVSLYKKIKEILDYHGDGLAILFSLLHPHSFLPTIDIVEINRFLRDNDIKIDFGIDYMYIEAINNYINNRQETSDITTIELFNDFLIHPKKLIPFINLELSPFNFEFDSEETIVELKIAKNNTRVINNITFKEDLDVSIFEEYRHYLIKYKARYYFLKKITVENNKETLKLRCLYDQEFFYSWMFKTSFFTSFIRESDINKYGKKDGILYDFRKIINDYEVLKDIIIFERKNLNSEKNDKAIAIYVLVSKDGVLKPVKIHAFYNASKDYYYSYKQLIDEILFEHPKETWITRIKGDLSKENFLDRREHTSLNLFGYNVNKQNNLSVKQRREILSMFIKSGIWSLQETIEHLIFLSNDLGKRHLEAAQKWESDIEYLKSKSDYFKVINYSQFLSRDF